MGDSTEPAGLENYLLETFAYMRQRESKLSTYKRRSPQLEHRRVLVDWLCTKGESLEFPKSTIHMALVLLDRFMDCHSIEMEHLHFVCLACLSVSGKFDMKETKVLRFSRLKTLLEESPDLPELKPAILKYLEGLILAHFDYNIFIPSPTHYVDLLLSNHVLFPDDVDVDGIPIRNNFSEMLESLTDFIRYFLDISMQDDGLVGEKYYVIGGASIFCARSVLEVWPIWPPHLERLFALSEAEFSKCSSTLLATYEEAEGKSQEPKSTKEVLEFLEDVTMTPPRKKIKNDEEFQTPDEGYLSRSSIDIEQTPEHPDVTELSHRYCDSINKKKTKK